jgi:transforming growth factor-beta-induced protein
VGTYAFSSDLFDGLAPTTLQGGTFEVNIDGDITLIDEDPDVTDPTVTGTDVLGTNGVVHIINGILLPIDTAL